MWSMNLILIWKSFFFITLSMSFLQRDTYDLVSTTIMQYVILFEYNFDTTKYRDYILRSAQRRSGRRRNQEITLYMFLSEWIPDLRTLLWSLPTVLKLMLFSFLRILIIFIIFFFLIFLSHVRNIIIKIYDFFPEFKGVTVLIYLYLFNIYSWCEVSDAANYPFYGALSL